MKPPRTHLKFELACRANAGYNDTVCDLITKGSNNKQFQNETNIVKEYINGVRLWSVPVSDVMSTITLLLWGAYIDRYKLVKPFLLIAFMGLSIECIGSVICVKYSNYCPVEIQGVLQYIVFQIFGGVKILSMAAFVYLNDISTPHIRTIRYAILYVFLGIWFLGAKIYTHHVHDAIQVAGSYLTALVFLLSGLFYGIYILNESPEYSKTKSTKFLIFDLFNLHHIVDTLKVLTHYSNGQRNGVIFILFVALINILTREYGTPVYASFLKSQNIEILDLTKTDIIQSVGLILEVGMGITIAKGFFKIHDLIILAIVFADKILKNVINYHASGKCGIYLGLLFRMLHTGAFPLIQSLAVSYVSKENVGKILGLLFITEIIGKYIKFQLYTTEVWNAIYKTNPRAFLMTAFILLPPTICALIWKYLKEKKTSTRAEVTTNRSAQT